MAAQLFVPVGYALALTFELRHLQLIAELCASTPSHLAPWADCVVLLAVCLSARLWEWDRVKG